jgi:YVTN family beta-propeller protein
MLLFKEIYVGQVPYNVVFSPDGLKAYVTVHGEDKVVVIDTDSFEIISRIPTRNIPFWNQYLEILNLL